MRRQTIEELASSSGGALATATVLRAFLKKGQVWTVAVGRSYRAIGRRTGDDIHWLWIGSHEAYNNMLQRLK